MKLAALEPEYSATGILVFDCPLGHAHRIRVRTAGDAWTASGTFPDTFGLTPSIHCIDSSCGWHGFITNGEVLTCP